MGRGRPGTGVEALATSIRISFTWQGKRYRETLPNSPTPPNIRYATRLVADIKKQIRAGTFDYATFFPDSKSSTGTGTFREHADKWLKLHQLEHSSKITYRNALKLWTDTFGDRPIRSITTEDILRCVAERAAAGIAPKTINNSLDPLRGVFNFAVETGAVTSNPMRLVKRVKIQKTAPDPFTKLEMDRILTWLQYYAPREVYSWYVVAFATGLRPSEQCALKREDVMGSQLKVERAFVRGKMKSTKTRNVRYVDLTRMAKQGLTGLTEEFLFGDMDEAALRAMHLKFWKPCLLELGIRHRSPYHTRHTYATVNLMAGVNPAYIARQLGHSNMSMLLSTYSRWIDGADGGVERAKVEAAFCPVIVQKRA